MVVTNNLNAVPILSASPNCTIIVTGGTVRPSDTGLVGAQAAATVHGFMFDHSIIGCSALDTQGGMFDYDLDEVVVSQAVISNSRQTILVADAAKFDRKAPARICNVLQMDAFVTDQMPVFTPRPETEIIVAD
jgi:DeoR family glycerol-3-phosphate regulon repressor